jgi:hypothetical protein
MMGAQYSDSMLRTLSIGIVSALVLVAGQSRPHTRKEPPAPAPHAHIIRVAVTLTRASRKVGTVHWRIENHNDVSVYVYSNYLWGPVFPGEHKADPGVIDTAPNEKAGDSCPTDFPPMLVLIIPPNDFREGDFADPSLKTFEHDTVAFRIGVGPEAERVTNDVYRALKGCKANPYNVIFDWSTTIESAAIPFPKTS